jgi:hypothetical protein
LSSRARLATAILLALAPGAAPYFAKPSAGVAGYQTLLGSDSLRGRSRPAPAPSIGVKPVLVSGYWSSWGLPPVRGQFTLSSAGVAFRPFNGGHGSPEAQWHPATVSLAYVEREGAHLRYLFRIDAGVFETDQPAPLLAFAADQPGRLGAADRTTGAGLVDAADSAAIRTKNQEVERSPYADSLYSLFGRPRAGIGQVGEKGRRAGRLGEYIASKDSLALDPGHITSEPQLRHALAHELAHRFQSRSKVQLEMLWTGVPPIRDPRRYGYNNLSEHQAEAIAFAVSFLQTTASVGDSSREALDLLDHYELLVPGTRIMVRYLLLQPIYARHPLRTALTTTRSL